MHYNESEKPIVSIYEPLVLQITEKRGSALVKDRLEAKGQCMPKIGQQHSIEKSRQPQRNLYLAAKKDKQRRFHALFDRIYRVDILWRRWKNVRLNRGSAGIDGITFEMIEEYGLRNTYKIFRKI